MGCGAIPGVIVGLFYKCLNREFENENDMFNDNTFINLENPGGDPNPKMDSMVSQPAPAQAKPKKNKPSEIIIKSGSSLK